jgi:uncharacterized YigZ family protein
MTDVRDSYETLAGPAEAELKVQRSRFLALATPATDEDAARAVIADLRRRHHDARHVCHAWRLGPGGDEEARNDDGEPSGTAGEPILATIRGAAVTDTVVAVVRWFGGVKLGTGGLVRAYGDTAAQALAAAPRRTVLLGRRFDLDLDYARQKTVRHLLDAHGAHVTAENYSDRVLWRLWLPNSRWQAFAAALTEATADQLTLLDVDDDS